MTIIVETELYARTGGPPVGVDEDIGHHATVGLILSSVPSRPVPTYVLFAPRILVLAMVCVTWCVSRVVVSIAPRVQ